MLCVLFGEGESEPNLAQTKSFPLEKNGETNPADFLFIGLLPMHVCVYASLEDFPTVAHILSPTLSSLRTPQPQKPSSLSSIKPLINSIKHWRGCIKWFIKWRCRVFLAHCTTTSLQPILVEKKEVTAQVLYPFFLSPGSKSMSPWSNSLTVLPPENVTQYIERYWVVELGWHTFVPFCS